MIQFVRNAVNRRTLALAASALMLAGAVLASACGGASVAAQQPSPTPATSYSPQTHQFTVSIVPLVVHEQQGYEDYLAKDFAPGGILDGKEIYGYSPSTLVVYQGDTVNITWVNPTDDDHTNVIPDFQIVASQNGESTAHSSFVANKVGTFTFMCAMAEHAPYMWGQIVVLPDSAAPQK